MLAPVADAAAALAALGPFKPADFTFRNYVQRPNVRLYSHESGAGLLAIHGADAMVAAGSDPAREAVMRDIFSGSFAPDSDWPNAAAARDWEREGRPYLFLNSSPLSVWEAGLSAGFLPPPNFEKHHHANLYWFDGRPRFSHHIQHSCRLGRGQELWDRLRQGIGYDEDGHYTRLVLQENPSFVCEVNGEPVSWSTVHLNGTMGMIYTPPEHRRQGFARSLACFQIDHVLRRHGFACCHVNSGNVASYSMLLELGATMDEIPVGWRMLVWPDGKCPYSV